MDEFSVFLKLAKPLVLNLPNPKDRTIAAQWLNKLRDVNAQELDAESDNISIEYLKLLLYAVQSNELTGIFGKPPPQGRLDDTLKPGQRTAMEMISLVKQPKTSTTESQPIYKSYPRVVTSIGGDMCEYVAVQEIPNFGIHGYYALSTEPLSKWWNPQNSITPETEISSPANEHDSIKDSRVQNSEEAIEDTRSDNTVTMDQTDAGQSNKEFSQKNREKMRHSEKSLRKIFQSQRSEIAGVETRPRWGRSRYIDRLIDESPHHVGDLDLSEADALLNLYHDRKLIKVQKNGRNGAKDSACTLSSRRRQVEARLDMPPCASTPVGEDFMQEAESESRTCLPREIESDCIDEAMRGNYGRCCLSENEEYYPTDPIESVGSISLRGGSDDAGLAARSGCCKERRDPRETCRRNQPLRNRSSLNDNTVYEPQLETLEGIDVDTEIAIATGLANGNVSLDATDAGNFAWVKKDMRHFLNDHTKMSSTEFKENTRRSDYSERYYNDTANSRSRACPRRIQQTFDGRQNDQWTSGSATRPFHAASQKTILRSKAASPTKPGVNEKAQYYWDEIFNYENRTEDPSMPESYDTSCCGCKDQQYKSEYSVHTEGFDDHDFAYENEIDSDQDLMMKEERSRNRRTMASPNDANALEDEVQRLIADPIRRAPPSRGRVKVPRKKLPLVVNEGRVEDENWDPPSHSTKLSR